MKRFQLHILFSFIATIGAAQIDTTKIVFRSTEGAKEGEIIKRDYLKMKDAKGEFHNGSFRKFKDGKIYTNIDTVGIDELIYIKVNTYKQQKTSSAYTAFGIAGVLNLAGFHAAFSEIREEEFSKPWLLSLGYATAFSNIATGIILYNYYDAYHLKGEKSSWEIKLD